MADGLERVANDLKEFFVCLLIERKFWLNFAHFPDRVHQTGLIPRFATLIEGGAYLRGALIRSFTVNINSK